MDGILLKLVLSLLLGLLIGLQRERTESSVAGIRTFALISLFGTVCGLIGDWAVAAGLLALAALLIIGNYGKFKAGNIDPGLTTELAAMLLFGVGAYLVAGQMTVAVVLGGAIALLLQFKKPMHAFVGKIGEEDIRAIMKFVLVTLVILPVVPNQAFGPHASFNPFKIWLFVVLIVGMSLIGYVLYKFVGEKAGIVLGGVLGGFISSTATTVSFARRSGTTSGAALVIMIASTILYVRVVLLVAAVAVGSLLPVGVPLMAMFVACSLICGVGFRWVGKHSNKLPPPKNPAALKTALILGALYAVINFAVGIAKDRFGTTGLYAVALLSGLVDVDAITLSTAQLVNGSGLEAATGWRAILIASMSNLLFKAGIVAWLGERNLLRQVALLFGSALVAGGAVLWLWPK